MKKHQMNSHNFNNMGAETINSESKGTQPAREPNGSSNLLGFTFHLSWMFLFLFLQEPGSNTELGTPIGPSTLYLASTLALAATLGVFAAKPRQLGALMAKRSACIGAAALTSLGTAGYCAATAAGLPLVPCATVGGMITGIGSGALAAQWAQAFGAGSIDRVLGATPTILAGAIALCVTLPFLPRVLCILLMCVLPLLSGMFAYRSAVASIGPESNPRRAELASAPSGSNRLYLVLAACSMLLGIILGCLNISTHNPLFAEYLSLFFMTAAVLVLFACVWRMRKRPTSEFLLGSIVPLCAIACLLVLHMRINENDFFSSFIPIGSTCLEMLFLTTLIIFSNSFCLSAIRTFAIGRISYALSYLVGSAAGAQLNIASSEVTTVQTTSFLLFAGIELITVAVIIGLFFTRQTANSGAKAWSGGDQAQSELRAPSAADSRPSAELADERQAPHHEEGAPADKQADADAFAEEHTEAETAFQTGKFERRVTEFATAHGLSARETDVLRQLLKGRGYARIQQELHIAEGTVNYHVRNIYAKTGVHSREKLVDLFDEFD